MNGHRDRRGRGLRGPLAPPGSPLSLTRAERFDDLVLDAVEHLQRHLPELGSVEVAVDDVPEVDALETAASDPAADPVPLGRALPASGGRPPRIVVHRRAVELRAGDPRDVAMLVREVVAEQVAALFGLAPEQVDPDYDDE
ncbi:MAG: metallopeptidase family protein [Candidatus Nanopelagicales bacterium]